MQARGKIAIIILTATILSLIVLGTDFVSTGTALSGNSSPANSDGAASTTSTSTCVLNGLAICVISTLPSGANYPVDSWYPGGMKSFRMRMENYAGSGWTSPDINAQQALQMISQMKPDVLERMISQPYSTTELNQRVPVCSNCAPMTFLQFLDNATQDCGCYITPRLSVTSIDTGIAPPNDNLNDCSSSKYSGYFVCQAYAIYNTPVSPSLEMLSLDDWASSCQKDGHFNCTSCSWDQSVFQPLYAMGWKGVSTLNGGSYYSACGWATYVGFDSGSQVNTGLLSKIKADSTVERIFMYDPDFPSAAQALQATCKSHSNSTYYGCDKVGNTVTMAVENQANDGYTYVYPVEQTFWDTTRMFLSNGTSMYQVMSSLISAYNVDDNSQTTTTSSLSSSTSSTSTSLSTSFSSSSTWESSSSMSVSSTSSFNSDTSSYSSSTSETTTSISFSSTLVSSSSNSSTIANSTTSSSSIVSSSSSSRSSRTHTSSSSTFFSDSTSNGTTSISQTSESASTSTTYVSTFSSRSNTSSILQNPNSHNSLESAQVRVSAAATMGIGTGACVFLAGLFPLSYVLKDGMRGLRSKRKSRSWNMSHERHRLGGN